MGRGFGQSARLALAGLPLLAGVVSCSTTEPGPEPDSEQADQTEEFMDAHRARFASYEVEAKDLPQFARYGIKVDSVDPIIIRHSWFTLQLVLGRRLETDDPGRFRTTSRYELATRNTVVQGESVFAQEDVGVEGLLRTVHVCHDAATGEIFIHEEHSWSVHRYLLMHPAPEGTRVSYVRLPFLRTTPPYGLPEVLGIRDGMLYVAQEGVIYGFPLRELLEIEELSYSIG